MPSTITLAGKWLRTDPDTGSNRLLPFDVPPGTSQISVRYTTEPLDGDGPALLDIGLFDPRGAGFLDAPGFRGWSSYFKSEFFVSEASATPGYLPGPILPGEWNLLIGADAAMLGLRGLSYRIEITLHEGDSASAIAGSAQPALPAEPLLYEPYDRRPEPRGQAWYRGNLHSHTFYSDGHNSIEEMADEHLKRGLHFGALTEHNILNPDLVVGDRPGFVWIPSEEVTTYRGHMNVWGISHWLDFRCDNEEQLARVIEAARAQGAVTSINHPKEDGPPWEFDLFSTDCMEVWQAPWFLGNFQSRSLWERLLREGRRIVAVGGSDLHHISTPDDPYPYFLDNPTTWVKAHDLTVPGILEGIGRGHVFISSDSEGPQLFLSADGGAMPAMMGDLVTLGRDGGLTVRAECRGAEGLLLRLITQEGVVHESPVLSGRAVTEYAWTAAGAQAATRPAYIRAELVRDLGPDIDPEDEAEATWVEAMTNPIYVSPGTAQALHAEAVAQVKLPVALHAER